jgi:hypothetical protein
MDTNQILPAGHPSIGTRRAVFQFVLGQVFVSVEAPNEWAVLCLERLLAVDGKVSDTCEVLSVIRDYRSLGSRSERVQEIPFSDFMTDIVDPGRITRDSVVGEAFRRALSVAERRYVDQKLGALPQETVWDEIPQEPVSAPQLTAGSPATDQPEKLTAALVNLGFKKAEVRKFVSSLGDEVHTEQMHALVRRGLAVLAA